MPKVADNFVSAILVVDEHTAGAADTIRKLSALLKKRYANYEVLIMDNGLHGAQLTAIKKLMPAVPCLRLIRLSRTTDTDTVIFAGIEASIGDFVCTLYNNDPVDLVPKFVEKAQEHDIVFGIANNMKRTGLLERIGARAFYWYSERYLRISVPNGSTYFICMNRTAANALTRSGRYMRHIRHMSKLVGFRSVNQVYELPVSTESYAKQSSGTLISRGIDLVSNYSSHPLRALSYFGLFAGFLNIVYACYVVVINLSADHIAQGWTTLSLQSSLMFFILFMIMTVLAEYIGKILNETQHEPPYHIMQELSSTISIADETRRNVTKK